MQRLPEALNPGCDFILDAISSDHHSVAISANSNTSEQGYDVQQMYRGTSLDHEPAQESMVYNQEVLLPYHAFPSTDHQYFATSIGLPTSPPQGFDPDSFHLTQPWNQPWNQQLLPDILYGQLYHDADRIPSMPMPTYMPMSGRQSVHLTPLLTESDGRRFSDEAPLSAICPPSSSTLFDDTHAFLTKPNSPIAPDSPAYATNPVAAAPPGTYAEQRRLWKLTQQEDPRIVPQRMYKPQAANDRKRYIDNIEFNLPIVFRLENASENGVSVYEAMKGRLNTLLDKDQDMFVNCGPSISIRINWPGYGAWSKQMPTKNWKSTPGPITRRKLVEQIARRIKDFTEKFEDKEMDEDGQTQWKVGGHGGIQLHDLELVSLHHVSKGSWAPQLRVIRRTAHQL